MGETTSNFGSSLDLGSVDSDSRIVTSTHTLVLNQRKEKALLELMEKTGYSIIQENGQRKYGGPPPGWTGVSPPKGSEIFVGKIPRDLFEDELVPVFETVGPIYEMRLMMDFSGCNRGYAFVMYTSPQIATNAVRKFNNFEIRKGKFLGVVKSVDNCRLFVGGIPKTKGREEILEEMQKVTEGVKDVILYSSVTDKSKSRGFAFIEYENHRAAAMARRKLVPGRRILLWGHEIAVDWAEPEPEVDEDTMSKVTVLYIRNLMLGTTEDQIRDAFNSVSLNGVEKVKKIRDFAFVHFTSRQRAEMALFAFDNKKLDDAEIEVTWAKPVDRNYYRMNKAISKGMFGNTGYGTLAFGQHGTYDPSLATNFINLAQSAPNPSDLLRFPLKHLSRGAAGIRGSRNALSLSPGYVKFAKSYSEIRPLYEVQPGMGLFPTNHFTLKTTKSPIQQLHELCLKNGWGEPNFCLLTLDSQDDGSSGTSKLYAYKVSISGLQAPYNSFQPDKLCDTPEDARNHAAVNVLKQLGVVISEGLDNLSRQLSGVSISNSINQSTVTPGTMLSVGPYAQQYLMASKLPNLDCSGGVAPLVSGTAASFFY